MDIRPALTPVAMAWSAPTHAQDVVVAAVQQEDSAGATTMAVAVTALTCLEDSDVFVNQDDNRFECPAEV